MKITISKKELNDYIAYRGIMRSNPCNSCQDRGCCGGGCVNEAAWTMKILPYEYASKLGDNCKMIKKYAELTIDIADAKHKADEWRAKAFELESKKGRLELLMETSGEEIVIKE